MKNNMSTEKSQYVQKQMNQGKTKEQARRSWSHGENNPRESYVQERIKENNTAESYYNHPDNDDERYYWPVEND